MAIKCGRGNHTHATLLDVRACYNGESPDSDAVSAPVSTVVANEAPATDKQIAFLCSLADQKLPADEASVTKRQATEGHWGRRSISPEINRLRDLPRRPAEVALDGHETNATAQTPVDLASGMYRMDETIYKVQVAVHGSGRPYAKRLVQIEVEVDPSRVQDVTEKVWRFEYAPGMVHKLRPEHKLTLEEAKAFGALYGTCCCCGRTLTNEESIENGIGPICAGKWF
jgi:hypothetical protein